MPIQILGRGMNNNIETELEWPLDPRRRERVVGYRKNFLFARDLRDRFKIDDFEKRIAGRLDPNHSRVFLDRFFEARRVGKIDISEFETGRLLSDFVKKSKRAAIEIVADDDVRTALEQIENRRHCRESGRETEP